MSIVSAETLQLAGVLPKDSNIGNWKDISGVYGRDIELGISAGCIASGGTPIIIKKIHGEVCISCSQILDDGKCGILNNLKTLGRAIESICPNTLKTGRSFGEPVSS